MISDAAADRILGSLREADGKGIVRIEDASIPVSTTSGWRSPIPAVSPAGSVR